MATNKYQKMLAEVKNPQPKISSGKTIKFPFSKYKEKMKEIDQHHAHVSMDGNTEKVTVKFLK